jgi:primosomal replication protein N
MGISHREIVLRFKSTRVLSNFKRQIFCALQATQQQKYFGEVRRLPTFLSQHNRPAQILSIRVSPSISRSILECCGLIGRSVANLQVLFFCQDPKICDPH